MFQIPERYRLGLEKLATLDDAVVSSLLDAIKNTPPTLHVEDIAAFANKRCGVEVEDVSEIVKSVVSLYSLRETEYFSTEQLVAEVGKALESESSLELPPSGMLHFTERLLNFLEVRGSLEIASKASDLRVEHENIFSSSRVLTDIRPIFKTQIQDGIGGALISHILKIAYQNINGSQESFFALDIGDIGQLLEQLENALEKEAFLKKLLEQSNVPYLDAVPDPED